MVSNWFVRAYEFEHVLETSKPRSLSLVEEGVEGVELEHDFYTLGLALEHDSQDQVD